ncbi:hypothetical protein BDW22DRAFT_1428195 [Trametopsis cervina]|nr:hypothetical protein BDW22DRAFT_1428195 [Trametopsis cervina]
MSYEMVEDLHERTVARPGAHHCPTNTTSTSSETSDVSRVQPKRLRITIPDTPPATPRTSSSPITTLWYPPSHDTDVCPAPGSAQIHALDNDQFVYRHKQACHSLDSHARTPMPAARSPCTPPPLIRQEYIPLPPVESPTLVSTPHSWTTNASSTQAKTRRFSVDSAVTSLPHIQEPDNELLSPLQLMDPLGHCPMDLVGPLDRCLMMVEQVQAVLPTSDEVQALWVSLSSAFTGIKKEAIRPLPSSHLAAVDDAKWQEIHDEVVASCARNLDRFLQVAGSVGRRPLDSHRISKVLYVFGWYALKFEDIERRFKIYSNHIHTLELRAELQSLNEIARAEADAERQNRHAAKVAAQRTKERREELKARILREEEAARVRR